jgi:hypothetical protein
MTHPYEPNPFEVLRLDPATPNPEAVARAGRLRQRARDEQELSAVRQAAQDLTGSPEARVLHELLTHPAPRYHWPRLERFRSAFRRPPDLPGQPPGGDPPSDPALAADEPVGEIPRENGEALWQRLGEDFFA